MKIATYLARHPEENVHRQDDQELSPAEIRVAYDSFLSDTAKFEVVVTGNGTTKTAESFSLIPRQIEVSVPVETLAGKIGTVEIAQDDRNADNEASFSVVLGSAGDSEVHLGIFEHNLAVPTPSSLCGCCGK